MSEPLRNRLRKIRLNFVSLVDSPAGVGAEVALFKRDTDDADSETIVLDGPISKNDPSSMTTDSGSQDQDQGTGGTMTKYTNVAKDDENTGEEDHDEQEVDLESMSQEELIGYIKNLETTSVEKDDLIDQMVASIESGEARVSESSTEGDKTPVTKKGESSDVSTPEEILKTADPAVVDLFKSMQSQIDSAQTMAKEERELRLTKRFEDEAKALPNIPSSENDIAKQLRQAYEVGEDFYNNLHTVLTKTNSAMAKSDIFQEIGKSGDNAGAATVDAKAQELRKVHTDMSRDQAVAKVLEDNPHLYDEYMNQKGR
jgi:hypothetical protein